MNEKELEELAETKYPQNDIIDGFTKFTPKHLQKAFIAGYKAKEEGWISVEKERPSLDVEVLCYAPDLTDIIGNILIGQYFPPENNYAESWTVYDFEESKMHTRVTHWQPLPEKPKQSI